MQAHVNLVMTHDFSYKGVQGGLWLILYKSGAGLASFAKSKTGNMGRVLLIICLCYAEKSGSVKVLKNN